MAEINDLEVVDGDNIDRFPEGMLGSEVNDSARALEGILARWHKDTNGSLVTTGSSNAYAVTPNRTISTYYDGLMIVAEINHDNTGAATLNAGPGARNIRLPDGTALIGGELKTGAKAIFIFDSDNNYWQLVAGSVLGRNIDITNVTALTAPAVADEALVYDADANTNRKITLANLLKVINALTAETAPATDDVLALYDTDGSATDKITLANLLKVINALTEDTTPDADADFLLTYDTSTSGVKKAKPGNIAIGSLIAIIEDQKPSGTDGQTLTPGADRTRNLNTLVFNRDTTVSLLNNQFTLPAGTWEIAWHVLVGDNNTVSHQSLLYNVSDSSVEKRGTPGVRNLGDQDQSDSEASFGHAVVTIASSKAFEIRHRVSATCTGGEAAGFGTEVHARVIIRRA